MGKQARQVLNHILEHGAITSLTAFENYGISRLSGVIYVLRHIGNVKIQSVPIKVLNRYGDECHVASYILEPGEKERLSAK